MTEVALTLADAVRYHMGTPQNPMEVGVLLELGERMPAAVLKRFLTERLLAHERFRQTVTDARGRPRWREERRFDLSAHVAGDERGPALRDAELARLVSERFSRPLGFSRSPWRMELIPRSGGASALLFRVHHCVADGLSLVRLLCELADDPQPPLRKPIQSPRSSHARSSRQHALRALPARSAELLTSLMHLVRSRAEPIAALYRVVGNKRFAWSPALDLARLSGTAGRHDCHMTELLLTACADAFARALSRAGHEVPSNVRALVPFGARLGRHELGNHYASMFVDLPLEEPDPWQRIARIMATTDKWRDPAQARFALALVAVSGWLSPPLMRLLMDFVSRRASFVLSNVPGPAQRVRLMGHDVRSIVVFAPASASLGVSFTSFGYAGELRIGVEVDAALPFAPERLVADVEQALSTLQA